MLTPTYLLRIVFYTWICVQAKVGMYGRLAVSHAFAVNHFLSSYGKGKGQYILALVSSQEVTKMRSKTTLHNSEMITESGCSPRLVNLVCTIISPKADSEYYFYNQGNRLARRSIVDINCYICIKILMSFKKEILNLM